ncbi:MAG TPA: phosphotyrosine protein phosphatase [Roseimicrobium sp.]|nr:phosphotyrosine protein phosphatase [Roseimicrobium sp.]
MHNHPTKLLFICSRNKIRSLTAEHIFGRIPGIEARSAGTQPEARIVVTEGQIGWADMIFVMEKSHLNKLRDRFPEAMQEKRVATLRIPDEYTYMQPELIDVLRAAVSEHLDLPDAS